jgi:hypothetical protein
MKHSGSSDPSKICACRVDKHTVMVPGHIPKADPTDPGSESVRGLDPDRDSIIISDDDIPRLREDVGLEKKADGC